MTKTKTHIYLCAHCGSADIDRVKLGGLDIYRIICNNCKALYEQTPIKFPSKEGR